MYNVISANRSPKKANKNWRIFEQKNLKNHFGPILNVNGEDSHSVLDAYLKHKDTIKYIRWYPDPEKMTNAEYQGMLNQSKQIGNIPYITSSPEGFICVQNKEKAFEIWKQNNINCPDYFVYRNKEDFYVQQEKHKIEVPFLVRVNNGVGGHNTFVVRDENQISKALDKMDSDFKNYKKFGVRIKTLKICVKLIDSIDRDMAVNVSYRVHVAGNKVVSGYARVVPESEWCAITAGKFNIKQIDNWIYFNKKCESLIKEREKEICKSVHVLKLNHQGVDIVVDQNDNLCFLEVQPTYAAGYPIKMGRYCPPYYNPYDENLVKFLQENKNELKKEIPTYYKNWLDKNNHFNLVYKYLKEYIDG